MKKIGLLTSGGDSSGMNSAIRAVVRKAIHEKAEVFGFKSGYAGLIENDFLPLNRRSVGDILQRGGTILKTARCQEFFAYEGQKKAFENYQELGLSGLIIIGGDGSFRGASEFQKFGAKVIGVPGTIDNDLIGTDYTLGFDTALNIVLDAIKKTRDTASAMDRAFIIEVMGRSSGWLALAAGLAGGAETIIIPEVPIDLDQICQGLLKAHDSGKTHSIIILAEGAGTAFEISQQIKGKIGFELKVTVLGHLQRGGTPSSFDRFLGSFLGAAAVELLLKGESGKMVGLKGAELEVTDLEKVITSKRKIDFNLYKLAQILDTPYKI